LRLGDRFADDVEPSLGVARLEFALHEGTEAVLQEVQCLADALVIGGCHDVVPVTWIQYLSAIVRNACSTSRSTGRPRRSVLQHRETGRNHSREPDYCGVLQSS